MSRRSIRIGAFRQRVTVQPVRRLACLFLAVALCVSHVGRGQTAGVNQGGPAYIHAPAGSDPMPQHGASEAEMKVEAMRQAERHQRVVADTARLLVLSNELKAQVDQMPKDQLSLDVVRKAAEIEKLAHDLKQWMKS